MQDDFGELQCTMGGNSNQKGGHEFLAELAKYGASLVLATQSLGKLDAIDVDRGLKRAVFANVDHLFAFNCSAEDARALAPELGAPIEPADLVELGDHQCYARPSHLGERLPAFHLHLDQPEEADSSVAQVLAACSAAQYGRDAVVVGADRAALLERLDGPVGGEAQGRANIDPEAGRIPPASAGVVSGPPPVAGRNQQRPRESSRARQLTMELREVGLASGADPEHTEDAGGEA